MERWRKSVFRAVDQWVFFLLWGRTCLRQECMMCKCNEKRSNAVHFASRQEQKLPLTSVCGGFTKLLQPCGETFRYMTSEQKRVDICYGTFLSYLTTRSMNHWAAKQTVYDSRSNSFLQHGHLAACESLTEPPPRALMFTDDNNNSSKLELEWS